MFTKEEQIQYHRHLILDKIGDEGQMRLKSARVLIVGAGGLGCPILQYLVAAGVGVIGIVDGDKVDQSNLQRQILYTIDDIGSYKADAAKLRLSRLNPYVEINVYTEYLVKDNVLDIIEDYDIIVDGSDNFQTRYLVNDAIVIANKPLVFGSIFKFDGQVTVFNYQGGPTYRCLYPTPPPPDAVPNCSDIGVLGVLPGIIGTLQASEAIKMICGIGEVLSGRLLNIDVLTLKQYTISFKRTKEADIDDLIDDYDFFCGVKSNPDESISYEEYLKDPSRFFLLDVRSKREHDLKNIGGLHIDLSELPERYQEIATDREILVYCQSGLRSAEAVKFLNEVLPKLKHMSLNRGIRDI